MSVREILNALYNNGVMGILKNRERYVSQALSEIKAEIEKKIKGVCTKEVTRLAVNELIPFEQTEPFKRLAILLDDKVHEALNRAMGEK